MTMTDYRIRATAADGSLRAVGCVATQSARWAQERHQASPLAAAAMGRTMLAALALAADFKSTFRLTVEVDGGGPAGRVVADIRTGGRVRARIQHPEVDLPLRADGKLAVGQAVGTDGYFTVIREEGDGEHFTSRIALASGEIGEDLLEYYRRSEQVPSAVALGVLVGQDGWVESAGGVVVQALPGCREDVVGAVADRFSGLNRISSRLAAGQTIEQLLREVLPAPVVFYDPEPVEAVCECSRTRSLAIISSLPRADIQSLVDDEGAELVCPYCRSAYQFDADTLRGLLSAEP